MTRLLLMQIIKYSILVLLAIILSHCQRINQVFPGAPTLWKIEFSDSSYFEFYFDYTQEFYFDSKEGIAFTMDALDTTRHIQFIEEIFTCQDSLKYSVMVLNYLDSSLLINKEIVSIKPLGQYFYLINSDSYYNYQLFRSESYERWRESIRSD